MPFNINEFTAGIAAGGLALSSNFDVMVVGPQKLGDTRDLAIRIDSVGMPTRAVDISSFMTSGPQFNVGTGVAFDSIPLTVIMSSDWREKELFEKWLDLIGGSFRTGTNEDFRIGYYDDYKGTVVINLYEATGDQCRKITMIDAFPIAMSFPPMSWDEKSIVKMLVTISYRFYKEEIV